MTSRALFSSRGLLLFAAVALMAACAGRRPAGMPPPEYREPRLPKWEPPKQEEEDPFDAIEMDGEWVEDPAEPADSPAEGAAGAPPTE